MKLNPRIFGAFLVGAGLISSAYFLAPKITPTQNIDASIEVVTGEAPDRKYIPVTDENQDGTPDWQESLRYREPVILDETASSTYTPPDTLTGQLAISLLQKTIQSKNYGEFGPTEEDILSGANNEIANAASDELYTTKDIVISSDNSKEALHTYGNRIAEIALIHGVPVETENEAVIVKRAMDTNDESVLKELDIIIASYRGMRDDGLKTPVPSRMSKEHLDLMNTYNALLIDIEGMQKAMSDPLYAMIRLKRYQDDASGLYYALINIYRKIISFDVDFTADDLAPQVFNYLQI